ncbi:aminotransferase class V-fold PLP-dependent enzyme [Archaeoglobus neptunius]|uniref:aminotransferase class V-fold PLP-dependent enzyme n=1 Tax=Archaeoglobus neptunius TaxID=2798580 RepID=UPI00192597CF|nr:aspartate aminotransferase family protein [Archaeoglobus neptunius]
MSIDEVLAVLKKAESEDPSPSSGRLFAYVYETGDENIRKVAREALMMFGEKNLLDFTVFKSAIFFEREVVKFARELMHGDDKVTGSFTFGGTESIMLAVKAARDHYRKKEGRASVPEILAPVTIHPAFSKAAHYLGLKVVKLPVVETKADVNTFNEMVSDKTALIALSAPNWPYGTVDPVGEISEIALDKDVLLHVDACLGGFILPFFEMLGEKIPKFDFRVEGVTSISLDVHKYGYAPKGSSVVLFRDAELKKQSMYVDVSSPGYVFVNQAVLSSRPEGPLAAAFAVISYLGVEGYRSLASKILSARGKIYSGMKRLGFKSVGSVESSILSLYSNSDLLGFVNNMKKLGWHLHLQKGLKEYSIPDNIHLTLSPVHESAADDFVMDAERAMEMEPEVDSIQIQKMVERGEFGEIIRGIEDGRIDSSVIPMLLDAVPEDVAVELIKNVVIEWFR